MTNAYFSLRLPMQADDISALANVATAIFTGVAVFAAILGIIAALKQLNLNREQMKASFEQINLLKDQLRFDAYLRTYELSRELHLFTFGRPEIQDMPYKMDREYDANNFERRRFIQQLCNGALLRWKAHEQEFIDDDEWEAIKKDQRNTFSKQEVRGFWNHCGELYPTGFREHVTKLRDEANGGDKGNAQSAVSS
jgi:hypothetical protein